MNSDNKMSAGAKEFVPGNWATPNNPPAGKFLPPKEKDEPAPAKKGKKPVNAFEQLKAQKQQINAQAKLAPPPSAIAAPAGLVPTQIVQGQPPSQPPIVAPAQPAPASTNLNPPVIVSPPVVAAAVPQKPAEEEIKPVAAPQAAKFDEIPKPQVEEAPKAEEAVTVEKKATPAPAAVPAPAKKEPEKKPAPVVVEEEEDEDAVKDEDPREHLNVVTIGHVDAGKSTLCGALLVATGVVDKRTIEKYEKEAKERNRESWYLAYIMDTNEEERARGKTVEVGSANFETSNKRFTILDAPGHKNYVPAMIAGASHADVAVLVISSRKGEFESGFEKQGQTREHAMLAFTIGIRKLIVVINKLDDPSVAWSKERYDEIEEKLKPFLKGCGYKIKKDVLFMPLAALVGAGVMRRITPQESQWACEINENKSLIETLEGISMEDRDPNGPLRISILDSYVDRGVWALGKIESGTLKRGATVCVSPTDLKCKIGSILIDEVSVRTAKPGENICVKLTGLSEENDCRKGYVLTEERIGTKVFTAQIKILELLEHRSIFTAGYTAVLHAHTIISDCVVSKILWKHDPETGKPIKERCTYARDGDVITIRLEVPQTIAIEPFDVRPQLGRITIRDEGKSIAIGKVKKLE